MDERKTLARTGRGYRCQPVPSRDAGQGQTRLQRNVPVHQVFCRGGECATSDRREPGQGPHHLGAGPVERDVHFEGSGPGGRVPAVCVSE